VAECDLSWRRILDVRCLPLLPETFRNERNRIRSYRRFVVDVFMIDGALLGLLWPAKFEKLAGFCIVGLSFTNLVMNAIGGTGAILCIINPNYKGDRFIYWLDFLEGVFSLIAIIAIVLALALPKTSKVLGLVAICAFIAVALCILIDFISTCTPASTGVHIRRLGPGASTGLRCS
jgi:hypothetical protein